MLLVAYEQGVKCAEVSIDDMTTSELQLILELWDEAGRSWSYEGEIKPFYFPRFDFDKGEEEEER